MENIVNIKTKIENEINNINNIYEKTKDELTKSFLNKHEKLIKEENDMKEQLDNEVTKVKEQLENYLSELNNEIKLNERINKGIKKLEKDENNMFRTLSYISKINKNKKEMVKLSQKNINSLKFCFKEEESKIIYEKFIFNALPAPNNIEFKDVTFNSLNIFWNYDKIDIDNNGIKFQVEMRKQNEDEKFSKIYEGNKTNCSINNLNSFANYEFRIRVIYKELNSPWSEIKTIKTPFNSIILKNIPKENEYVQKLMEWTNSKKLELIYRGTRDGSKPENFHNLCDNKGPTITLFKNEKGNIFGGYASISWANSGEYKSAPDSFIFTLTNIHNTEPTKFQSKKSKQEVYHSSSYGPWFGGGRDIGIYGDFTSSCVYSSFPYTYVDNIGKGKSIFTGDINNNNNEFKLIEVEVFKICK